MSIPFSKFQPQEITPENINAFINDQLGNWSENVQRLLINNLKKSNIDLTHALISSFANQVHNATSESIASVQLAFLDYGRMKDMRRLFYTKMPPVEAMEEFVRKVGLSKFKYVPGYSSQSKVPSESIAIKRIAWGIAAGRLKSYKHKPKKWFAKAFYGQIEVLIQNMISGYKEYAINSVANELRQSA